MPRRHAAPLPDFISPQLAQLADSAPEGDAWLHEVKIDGYRVAARITGGKVHMFTRRANDWTPRFRPIGAILAKLPVKAAYIDGEVAVLTAEGVSDFGALQETLGRRGRSHELAFIAFDLLHLDGRDLRRLPLIERKAMLEKLLAKLPARSPIQFAGHVTGQGPAFFALACERRLEGIISKRPAAPYRSGRASDWVKVKCTSRQEFVIGGYRHEVGRRPNLGSLLLGYFNRGRLTYAGSVGTGWSIQLGRSIMAALQCISRETPPFIAVPRADAKDAKWAEPRLVCDVEFTQWTRDGRARQPAFKGLREDKAPWEVRREVPK